MKSLMIGEHSGKVNSFIFMIVLLLFSYVGSASASPWIIETVDNINPWTAKISLALDSNGKTHISYFDTSNKSIKYANNVSGSWAISAIRSGSVSDAGISMVIDSIGKVHIGYQESNGDLLYSTNASGSWVSTVVDVGVWPTDPAIAVDTNNKIHISYFDLINFDLKYASNSSGTWQKSVIVNGGAVGPLPYYASAIAVDKNRKVHIGYYDDASPDSVKYVTNVSGNWQITTIENIGLAAGWQLSIAVDQSIAVHMAYYNWTNDELKYATNASGSWIKIKASTGDDSGIGNMSLALDNSGMVHISYITNGGLKHTTNRSGTWKTEMVESGGTQSRSSLAISPGQRAHIGYYNYVYASTNGYDVRHAYQAPISLGDLNDDGLINLEDAILAIQVCAGMTASTPIYKQADVNGDSKIGLAEVIYILQKVAG